MKVRDIVVGRTYTAKVSGKVVPVRVLNLIERFSTRSPNGRTHWICESLATGRRIEVKSCQRFREPVLPSEPASR